jgi:formate hydrogenlyase transcriptional activator
LATPELNDLLIVDAIPAHIWRAAPDGAIQFVNRQWMDYTGLSQAESQGWAWASTNVIHPDDLPGLLDTWQRVLAAGQPDEAEARIRRVDGEYRWYLIRAVPVRDQAGAIVGWYGTNTDIEERKRAQALLRGENEVLEKLAQGHELRPILDGLCRMVEGLLGESFVSIMLLNPDGDRLFYAATGSLPSDYVATFDGVTVGPSGGPCGTAAYRNAPVIVPDIDEDPGWVPCRTLAAASGVRACWSTPIRSSDGVVLGTFAVVPRRLGSPTAFHRTVIAEVTHLASLAIMHTRRETALRRSETQYRQIIDAIPQLIAALSPTGKVLYANKSVLEYSGLSEQQLSEEDFRHRIFFVEDLDRLAEERQRGLENGIAFELEIRTRHHSGHYRWCLIQYKPVHDERGRVVRWYATGTDIDDRRRAEDRIRNENLVLREEISRASMFEEVVGTSDAVRAVLRQVGKVAPTDSTVLISGETGTGKELIARAIHRGSSRSSRAFVTVNCAAIPSSLIASELFGHERGAFTGALQRRQGKFELADSGTIFLDEIGELPPETQMALLRVLQEREFERVGSNRPQKIDVRVIAATNRDLQAAVDEKSFRSDLFYRLNVFPIDVPPLRDRATDIPLLVEYFVHRFAKRAGKKITDIAGDTLHLLRAYPWPGNIRELQNVVERAVIVSDTETLTVDERWLGKRPVVAQNASPSALGDELLAHERARVEAALSESNGRVSGPDGAAARLGIPRSTLESKIRSLRIDKNRFKQGVDSW